MAMAVAIGSIRVESTTRHVARSPAVAAMVRPRTNTSCAFLVRPAGRKESGQEQIVKERTQEAFKSAVTYSQCKWKKKHAWSPYSEYDLPSQRQPIGVYQNMEAA